MILRLSLLCLFFFPSLVFSEVYSPIPEVKNLKIKKYAWQKETKYDEFCNNFLSTLKSNDIHFLQPVIQPKSVDDVNFVSKFNGCDISRLVTSFTFEPRILREIKDLPEDERNKYGRKFVQAGPFKVYDANIYNEGFNSPIIYGSCNMDIERDNTCKGHFTHFNVIDIKNCKVKNHRQVLDEDYSSIDVNVGVLNFEGSHYFFESSYRPKEDGRYFTLYYWNYIQKKNKGYFQKKCLFSTGK